MHIPYKKTLLGCFIFISFQANASFEEGFSFHGYAKEGIALTNDQKLNPSKYEWANTGGNVFSLPGNLYFTNTSGGTLGNESNWIELHFDYGINTQSKGNWAAKINVASGGGFKDLNLDEMYVIADDQFASAPEMKIWAGKRYYQRVETYLTDSQSISSDGHGFGIENWDLGFGALAFGITIPSNADHSSDSDGNMTAFNSSINNIELTDSLSGDIYFNYGTFIGPGQDEKEQELDERYPDTWQLAAKLKQGNKANYDEVFVRYSSNSSSSITRPWETTPDNQLGGFFQGRKQLSKIQLDYIWQFEYADYDADAAARNGIKVDNMQWNTFVVRFGYPWNQRTSTDLETGYEYVNFDPAQDGIENGTNQGYKVALSQNIHLQAGYFEMPLIRFFVTYAEQDVENTELFGWRGGDAPLGKSDAVSVGVQFEAGW